MSDMETNELPGEAGPISVKLIGVGGAGTNIVDRLMLSHTPGIELAAVNTDQQSLADSPTRHKLCIGKSVTGGLGAGGDVEIGREAALADIEAIDALVKDVDLLFLAAGLGGGTGTGAAPVIAEQALKQGALVIAFVALPFSIERAKRANTAQEGLLRLREVCNAVIPLPNDLLIQESESGASLLDAFSKADAWIERAVRSIYLMMTKTGIINLDFAQLRQAFAKRAGKTLFGLGNGSGPDAAVQAVEDLKLCPLLHTPEFSKKAEHLLVNIVGGAELSIDDTQMIMEAVVESFGADASIAMGAVIDEELGDQVEICVVGTSDVSSVPMMRVARRKIASAPPVKAEPVVASSEQAAPYGAEAAVSKSKARPATHVRSSKLEQHEFSFTDTEPKGEFENSTGAVFEGQDLDSPTYLRKGVKIVL